MPPTGAWARKRITDVTLILVFQSNHSLADAGTDGTSSLEGGR